MMVRVNDVHDWHEAILAVKPMLGKNVQSWFVGHHVYHDDEDDETVDHFCHRPGCGALISGAGAVAVVEDAAPCSAGRRRLCWAFLCQACADREEA